MATAYKVNRSLYRLVIVELPNYFPYSSKYPYHAEFFQVEFHDDGSEMYTEPKLIAKAKSSTHDEMSKIINAYGRDWVNVDSFMDGIEALVNEYEERYKSVPKFRRVALDDYR